jgi:hypothetical protein
MSDTHGTLAPDQPGSSHAAADDHGAASGQGDGHGHDAHGGIEALGPIDWTMWGVGVLGVAAALLVAAGFVIATSFSFTA